MYPILTLIHFNLYTYFDVFWFLIASFPYGLLGWCCYIVDLFGTMALFIITALYHGNDLKNTF